MKGWFSVNRAMLDHPIFAGQPMRVAAWVWIVGSAAWKDTKQDANGKTVHVKRGQLLTSYRQMSNATGVSIQTLRTLIERLQRERAIYAETNTGRLLITICNYEKYQASDASSNTGPTQDQHRTNTQKEQENNKQSSSNDENALSAPAGETVEVSILSKAVWDMGKPFLASRGVKNPGSVIGKWLKSSSPPEIMTAMEMAQKAGTQDPVPYITQILIGGFNGTRTSNTGFSEGRSNRPDPALEQIARLAGLGKT